MKMPNYTSTEYCWRRYTFWYYAFCSVAFTSCAFSLTAIVLFMGSTINGWNTAGQGGVAGLVGLFLSGVMFPVNMQRRFWRSLWKIALDIQQMNSNYAAWLRSPSVDGTEED